MATERQRKRKFQDFDDDDEDLGRGQAPDSVVTNAPLPPLASSAPRQQLDGGLDCFEEDGGDIDEDMLGFDYPVFNGDGSGSQLGELDECTGDFALSFDADEVDDNFESTNATALDAGVSLSPSYFLHCGDGPWFNGVDGAHESTPDSLHEEGGVQRSHSAIERSSAAGEERGASEPVREQPRAAGEERGASEPVREQPRAAGGSPQPPRSRKASATPEGGSQRRSLSAASLDDSICMHDGPAATLRQQSEVQRRDTVSPPRSSTTSSTTPAGSDQVRSPSSATRSGCSSGPCVSCFIRCKRNRRHDCVMVKSGSTPGKVACQACASCKTQCEPMPAGLVSEVGVFWAKKNTMLNTQFNKSYGVLRDKIIHAEPTTRQGMERQMRKKLYLVATRALDALQRIERVGRVWDNVASTSNAA